LGREILIVLNQGTFSKLQEAPLKNLSQPLNNFKTSATSSWKARATDYRTEFGWQADGVAIQDI